MTAAANLITMLAPARPSLRGLGERERLLVGHALCLAVVACTSAIHALLAFTISPDPAHNFLLKRGCCHFA